MPDWSRIFPDADHRWVMGLRQGDLADFFTDVDPSGTVRAEHLHWLNEDLEKYSAVLPEARPALAETLALAQSFGAPTLSETSESGQLKAIAQFWEPDIVWMHPDSEGTYRLMGGIVCFPSSWAIREKLGLPMRDVHDPVPALNATLSRQVDTFLSKQVAGVPWRRENWSLARDGNLNHHVSRSRARLDASIKSEEVFIRLEHQLLYRLPQSGSILFGIRLEIIPLGEVLADHLAATRLLRIIRTIPETAAAYKGFASARPALIEMLAGSTASETARGQ